MKIGLLLIIVTFGFSFLQHKCGNKDKAIQSPGKIQASNGQKAVLPHKSNEQPSFSPTQVPTTIFSPSPTPEQNPLYSPNQRFEDIYDNALGTYDWDCDGVRNIKDNCIYVYNPDQKDKDGDGIGNACDPRFVDPEFTDVRCDEDRDGIPDDDDNCPTVCNPDQKDINSNEIGDVCDQAFPNAVFTLQICKKPKKVKNPTPPKPPIGKNN